MVFLGLSFLPFSPTKADAEIIEHQITDDGSGNILMSPIQSGSSTGSITSGGLGLGSGLAGSGGSNLTWPY